ncbi:unnamed protein product [Rhizophagus irregularis]|nr:unnamed protein product [Rhizophagus irregularis]
MTFEFEENDIEETAEEEVDEETEYETEEEIGEEAEEEAKEEAEYENEDEAESKTEENQVDDTETEEQQIEKNIEREVEQEETNTKKRSTSGMAGHIKSKHKLMKEKGKKQLTIRESINNSEVINTFTHWVTENWKLKSFLLDFIKLEGLHSGANIKDAFLKSLKNFNIESKILGVTTDNASNNVIFLKAVESDLSQRYIYNDSEDKHVRCLAHIINLAAQQVLTTLKATDNDELSNEEVGSLIVKLHTLIKKIKASPQQIDKFKAQCKVANVLNLNVILDVRTRWNSTYDILVRARKLKEPLNILSNSDSNLRSFTINEDKWINLLEIEELLKYFAKATKQICGEAYPTLSYVIPIYNILLNKLEDFRDTPNRFENGKEVAINAINKLKIYYNKTDSTLYAVSLILDPRLKVEYMKNNEWETQWVDRTKKTVSELYIMLYTPQETQNTNIKYNSSDEDLVSHICKWRRIETVSEFDRYLNADHAQALCDTLN